VRPEKEKNMGIRGELFSQKVLLPNRTYFFNVKENRLGDLYLNIVESKNRDSGGFDRQSVILFADDLQEFLKGFDESLRVMEKAMRDKKHKGSVKREANIDSNDHKRHDEKQTRERGERSRGGERGYRGAGRKESGGERSPKREGRERQGSERGAKREGSFRGSDRGNFRGEQSDHGAKRRGERPARERGGDRSKGGKKVVVKKRD
jgi:hypothetical protein